MYITTPVQCQELPQCCYGIKCFREFCSTDHDLNNCLQCYAENVEKPHYKDMIEAIFECFEALLNYKGKSSKNTMYPLPIVCLCHIHTYRCRGGQGSTGSKHRVIDKDCQTQALQLKQCCQQMLYEYSSERT